MKILTLDQIRADRAALTRDARIHMPSSIERAADKPIRVVISTDEVDRYRSVINQDGWQLEQYRANPVVLWMHDYGTPAIARTAKVEVDDKRLVAEPVFPERGTYALADTVHDLVRGGFINAASVGWSADEWTYDEELGGMRFIRQTLMEWSFVTVPGNAGALVEARALGIDIDPMRAHAEAILKATGSRDAERVARAGEKPRLYVFARGDVRVEAPSAKRLARAVEALKLATATVTRADEPADDKPAEDPPPKEPAPEPDETLAMKCACGREYGTDDKFCAACGEKRAEPEPAATDDEIDAERVLAAIERITK
jgi:uncharacterized protein